MERPIIDVIIPAFNEENGVGHVIEDIPSELVREIIVCNNNSSDQTARVAKQAGATVVFQKEQGYGNACLAGMAHVANKEIAPDIIVFIDADYSDFPEEMPTLVRPIIEEDIDLVIGSRALGESESGSMTIPQIVGNVIASRLIRILYKVKFTDLGPFRAIRYPSLLALNMQDKTYGWTVEMQVKAAKQNLSCTEVPVRYKQRIGKSKVSGTLKGAVMAGYKIIWTIFKLL